MTDEAKEYHGYPQGVPAPSGDGGVDLLRKLRGEEQVTFNDVADHLTDYAKRHPASLKSIDGFARYVAEIETVDHDHDAIKDGSIDRTGEPPEA
jgi:hypothetical protein